MSLLIDNDQQLNRQAMLLQILQSGLNCQNGWGLTHPTSRCYDFPPPSSSLVMHLKKVDRKLLSLKLNKMISRRGHLASLKC